MINYTKRDQNKIQTGAGVPTVHDTHQGKVFCAVSNETKVIGEIGYIAGDMPNHAIFHRCGEQFDIYVSENFRKKPEHIGENLMRMLITHLNDLGYQTLESPLILFDAKEFHMKVLEKFKQEKIIKDYRFIPNRMYDQTDDPGLEVILGCSEE